jgi:F0F1-type ATP synthase epsilon subunit
VKLHLISPTQSQNYTVNWIELNTDQGNFVIQHGHAPMIVMLKKDSIMRINYDGKTTDIVIKSGIAEINRMQTTILITHE